MALKVGITIADFEVLTLGMILDIIATYINENIEQEYIEASESDYINF